MSKVFGSWNFGTSMEYQLMFLLGNCDVVWFQRMFLKHVVTPRGEFSTNRFDVFVGNLHIALGLGSHSHGTVDERSAYQFVAALSVAVVVVVFVVGGGGVFFIVNCLTDTNTFLAAVRKKWQCNWRCVFFFWWVSKFRKIPSPPEILLERNCLTRSDSWDWINRVSVLVPTIEDNPKSIKQATEKSRLGEDMFKKN